MLNRGNYAARLNDTLEVLETLSDDADLAALFGIEGPESPILQRGWALYRIAFDAHYARQRLWGVAVIAMAQCTAAFQNAREAQARLTLLARALFTTPGDRDRLGINGRRAEGLGAWLLQAEVFHTNLTDADHAALNQFGVATAELERTAQLLSQLALDHAACIAAKAAAKTATLAKVAAFADLAAFLSPLIAVARGLESRYPKLPALLRMRPDGRRRAQRRAAQSIAEPQPNPNHEPDPDPDPDPEPDLEPEPDPEPMPPPPSKEADGSTTTHTITPLAPTPCATAGDASTHHQPTTSTMTKPGANPIRRPLCFRRAPGRSDGRHDRAGARFVSRPGPNRP